MKHIRVIAWVAVRELVYERVFYLWLAFVGFSFAMSLLLGQMTYTERAKLTIDFMLAGMEISMVLFAIFMSIFLFKREITLGSIYMLLSKPISRSTFLLGKFIGQVVVEGCVLLAMAGVTILMCLGFNSGNYVESVFQSAMLIFAEVSVITAVTYLFAVNSGPIMTALSSFTLFGAGHLRQAVSVHLKIKEGGNMAWEMTKAILPDFEIFNMKALASYGHALPWESFGWAWIYAGICMFVFLSIAIVSFAYKDVVS